MIYTCYDMVRDCHTGRTEGWSYFVTHYVPVVEALLEHYYPKAELLDGVLAELRGEDSVLFRSIEPAPERIFVSALRQKVLEAADRRPAAEPEIAIDTATLLEALAPLTLVEKQAMWLETMRYRAGDAARMLRADTGTVEKVREKGAELVRGRLDAWRRTLLADNGRALGRAAAAAQGSECLPPKLYLDTIDGRTTWGDREMLERHASGCAHCLDHFCRMLEAVDLLRSSQPLEEDAASAWRVRLGIAATPRPAGWKRLFGAG